MIQTGLIQNAHSDLVTDAAYDFYGLRLATCSLDQRIKVWHLDESNGTWNVEDDWKAHDAPVSKLSWAHPEFGSILASGSFDRTVKVWEQATSAAIDNQQNNASGSSSGPSSSRWVERAVLPDARGTVRAVEFAPHHFGLKLATFATDNLLRIYECLEQPTLSSWQLTEEIDVLTLVPGPSPSHLSRAQSVALATPTQTHATLDAASASLVAQALQQGLQQPPTASQSRPGLGNREADGGWCISWCKDRYWGEIIAVAAGTSGVVKVIQLNSRRSIVLVALDASPAAPASVHPAVPHTSPGAGNDGGGQGASTQPSYSITSVAWAPSCGRSYHLIATGGRDGHVRVWKVKPPPEDSGEDDTQEEGKWTALAVADFDQHKSAVGRVEWNVTGTVLSSAGNDGRIRLWKATAGNVWRPAGSIGVEQAAEEPKTEPKDVEMEG